MASRYTGCRTGRRATESITLVGYYLSGGMLLGAKLPMVKFSDDAWWYWAPKSYAIGVIPDGATPGCTVDGGGILGA